MFFYNGKKDFNLAPHRNKSQKLKVCEIGEITSLMPFKLQRGGEKGFYLAELSKLQSLTLNKQLQQQE